MPQPGLPAELGQSTALGQSAAPFPSRRLLSRRLSHAVAARIASGSQLLQAHHRELKALGSPLSAV